MIVYTIFFVMLFIILNTLKNFLILIIRFIRVVKILMEIFVIFLVVHGFFLLQVFLNDILNIILDIEITEIKKWLLIVNDAVFIQILIIIRNTYPKYNKLFKLKYKYKFNWWIIYKNINENKPYSIKNSFVFFDNILSKFLNTLNILEHWGIYFFTL